MSKMATREQLEQENKALKKELADRIKLEDKLSESEEKYRKLFEHAGFAIDLLDADTGERLMFNKEAHKCLGFSSEEYQILHPEEIDDNENPPQVLEHFKEIIRKGSDLFERRHIAKSGELCDMLISAVPIFINGKYTIQSQ